MKILNVLDYASLENLGGDCKFAFEVSAELKKRGHEVTVLAGNEQGERDFEWCGVRIVYFNYNPVSWGPIRTLRGIGRDSAKRFTQVLGGAAFDIAVFHQPLVSRAFRRRKLLGNARRVYNFHSPWHLEYAASTAKRGGIGYILNTRFRRRLEKRALQPAEMIITLSAHMKELAMKFHGCPESIFRTIPGGVDLDDFKPAGDVPALRKELGLPPDKPVLFCMRRLVGRMGIDNLLYAWPAVLMDHPEATLLIAGRGPQEVALMQLTETLSITDSVKFLGYLDADDARRYYSAADACIVPSRELEGFGLVLIESLASGTPALATPVGGMSEVIEPLEPKWIFGENTAESIAEGIKGFLAEPVTPDVRGECRKHAEKFTWSITADRMEEAFKQLLKSRK